jgi:AAA domain
MTIGADQFERIDDSDTGPARPTTRASQIPKTRLRWTWRGRLALGYLAVWCGAGDIGKSMFAAWVIKQLNYGLLPGEFEGTPQSVLIVCTEDGRDDMWRPRLEAVGANLDLVEFLNYPRAWNLKDGISWIDNAITGADIPLTFIDALMSHMPEAIGNENTRSPTFVRAALEPFADLCKQRKVTGLFGLHPRKAGGDTFADVVQESGVFTQLPRLGLMFGYHPDDLELPQEQQRRVIVRGKGNVGRNPGALSFRIAEKFLDWGDQDPDGTADGVGYITDVQPCDVTERQLLHPKPDARDRDVSKAQVAQEYITLALADGDWHESKPIEERLAAMDITSGSTITTAKENAGVKSRKRPGVTHGPWEWQIPHSSNSDGILESWPPRATLDPLWNLESENAPNTNNHGKNPTFRPNERTAGDESQDSNIPPTTRAREADTDEADEDIPF